MLDIKQIRENPAVINQSLQRRNPNLSVDPILALDVNRRQLLQEEETLRSERNILTKQIGAKKPKGENCDDLLAQSKTIGDRIKAVEEEKLALDNQQTTLLLDIPNTPLREVPDGKDDADNVELRSWGESYKARPVKDVQPHWDMGTQLGILDFERGVKLAQSRFSVFRGAGSQLNRALIQFMLDVHSENGYEEILPPFLVNAESMTGTGQLPKFEADMFRCRDDALYLIPTAEVPVTNLYRDEILSEEDLPMWFTAYTPCFRREAGSAGKDTRGLIRQHQFDKVELVKLVEPQHSDEEWAKLVTDAERILQLLELPYRAMALCAGDLGFSAARCIDLEVWMPAQGVYREISSCSNFLDFQARRANLKYRPVVDGKPDKPQFVHTINGSGLAVGRTVAAILENYQISHQEVAIPTVLQPYFKQGQKTLLTKAT